MTIDAIKFYKIKEALGKIACGRRPETGGNYPRRDLVQIARVALLDCGYDWPPVPATRRIRKTHGSGE